MRLDHISYACTSAEVADVVQRIGFDLGATFVDGGRHPSFGTRNFIFPLAGNTYVEVVAALDHPAADKAPFGRAVKARADEGGGWLGWVVGVEDLHAVEARLGRQATNGRRIRPDGFELNWKQIGVLEVMEDAQLPFFVHWDIDEAHHPSAGASSVSISSIEICGDADRIGEYLGEPADHPLDDITVHWVDAEEPGVVAVTFSTPNGLVRLD